MDFAFCNPGEVEIDSNDSGLDQDEMQLIDAPSNRVEIANMLEKRYRLIIRSRRSHQPRSWSRLTRYLLPFDMR